MPDECTPPETTTVTTATTSTAYYTNNTTVSNTQFNTTTGYINRAGKNNKTPAIPAAASTVWQAVAIVSILFVLLLILLVFIGTRTKFKRYLQKRPRITIDPQTEAHLRNGWFVSRTGTPLHSSPTRGPPPGINTDYLSPFNIQPTSKVNTSTPLVVPLPSHNSTINNTHVSTAEGLPVGQYQSTPRTSAVLSKSNEADLKQEDPIYSDIPAYSVVATNTLNSIPNYSPPAYSRPSSDFDTDDTEELNRQLSIAANSKEPYYSAEAGLSADEERDIIRTLRKKRSDDSHVRNNGFQRSRSYSSNDEDFSSERFGQAQSSSNVNEYNGVHSNGHRRLSRENFTKISGKRSPIFVHHSSYTPIGTSDERPNRRHMERKKIYKTVSDPQQVPLRKLSMDVRIDHFCIPLDTTFIQLHNIHFRMT